MIKFAGHMRWINTVLQQQFNIQESTTEILISVSYVLDHIATLILYVEALRHLMD